MIKIKNLEIFIEDPADMPADATPFENDFFNYMSNKHNVKIDIIDGNGIGDHTFSITGEAENIYKFLLEYSFDDESEAKYLLRHCEIF